MEKKKFVVTDNLLASQGQRFLNYIIDFVVQMVLMIAIGFVFLFIVEFLQIEALNHFVNIVRAISDYVLGTVVMLIYYSVVETIVSQSVGKFATKTVVVMKDGSKPTFRVIFKRTLCRIIPFDGLTFLGGKRGWHDSISHTYVVRKEVFERERDLFYAFDEIGVSQEG